MVPVELPAEGQVVGAVAAWGVEVLVEYGVEAGTLLRPQVNCAATDRGHPIRANATRVEQASMGLLRLGDAKLSGVCANRVIEMEQLRGGLGFSDRSLLTSR